MKRYDQPKVGVFKITTDKYEPGVGWVLKEEEHRIIGETKYDYITRFLTTSCPYSDDLGCYEAHYTIAIGIHKSRFVEWKTTQTSLFN
ncbi:MAG: hypothetical protein EOO01_33150 [Chitinophagaceae bacterium]|nr:MAG: hypothetical protein EOO01_33150 [Chitinophagaceae bacterium]